MRRKIFPDHNTFRESPLEGTQNLNVTNRKSQNVLHWMDRLHKACYKISPSQDLSLLTKRFKNVCIFENRRKENKITSSGARTAYPSGASEFNSVLVGLCYSIFSFLCSALYIIVCTFPLFSFWSLYCMSFDL